MAKLILLCVMSLLLGGVIGFVIRMLLAITSLNVAEKRAKNIIDQAKLDAETQKKQTLLEAQTKVLKEREVFDNEKKEFEKEQKQRRNELEKRNIQKEEQLDRKTAEVERREQRVNDKEKHLNEKIVAVTEQQEKCLAELERISGLTSEQAKSALIKSLEDKARQEAQIYIRKIEEETEIVAKHKAREILVTTIQRISSEVTSDVTTTSVSLPNDEMKGRIIGREGRNIRTLETAIGVDIIIDDTPEAIVISSFDPIRREVAKIVLNRLVTDGRIHPARIEEVTKKVLEEVNETIFDKGEEATLEIGMPGFSTEGIMTLGRLYFRTSYGQNVLQHSIDVATIAGALAKELGCDENIAKRGGLLHDIGKGATTDGENNHAEAGYEMAKKMGENEKVLNCILSHHGDVEPTCLEAILVQAADAISASRPGARRESLENYIKRLENLEQIANAFDGVERSFAIQAGRELRVILNSAETNEEQAMSIARDVAKRIESELKYPGKIKVTVVRESRFVEYAK
jgi:ribonuclease Y